MQKKEKIKYSQPKDKVVPLLLPKNILFYLFPNLQNIATARLYQQTKLVYPIGQTISNYNKISTVLFFLPKNILSYFFSTLQSIAIALSYQQTKLVYLIKQIIGSYNNI